MDDRSHVQARCLLRAVVLYTPPPVEVFPGLPELKFILHLIVVLLHSYETSPLAPNQIVTRGGNVVFFQDHHVAN